MGLAEVEFFDLHGRKVFVSPHDVDIRHADSPGDLCCLVNRNLRVSPCACPSALPLGPVLCWRGKGGCSSLASLGLCPGAPGSSPSLLRWLEGSWLGWPGDGCHGKEGWALLPSNPPPTGSSQPRGPVGSSCVCVGGVNFGDFCKSLWVPLGRKAAQGPGGRPSPAWQRHKSWLGTKQSCLWGACRKARELLRLQCWLVHLRSLGKPVRWA